MNLEDMIKVKQEVVGDFDQFEHGEAILFTQVEETDEDNDKKFVLGYIDCNDDVAGVVANGAFADQLR